MGKEKKELKKIDIFRQELIKIKIPDPDIIEIIHMVEHGRKFNARMKLDQVVGPYQG